MLDIAIIGGGPAGLAAGLKAATEGLNAAIFEASDRLGGRCASSPRIENIPGFPGGISGEAYGRALASQLDQFGCRVRLNAPCSGVAEPSYTTGGKAPMVRFQFGGVIHWVHARTVLITSGLTERRIRELEAVEETGQCHYRCDPRQLHWHRGERLLFVGGGNSSAQLGLEAADNGAHVTLLTKRELKHNVSAWLLQRIEAHPNVDVIVGELGTVWHIKGMVNAGIVTEPPLSRQAFDHVYAFPGGEADVTFFPGEKADDGRIRTGWSVDGAYEDPEIPYLTSMTGVFAAGDVRFGNTGSVAVAAGEGTHAVQTIAKVWLPERYGALEPLARN